MITFMSLFLLFILLAAFLIIFLVRKKKLASIVCGAALFLVCCLFGVFVYITGHGYTYKTNIDTENLEAFHIDLDTAEQYEEWFCPETRFETEDYLYMQKGIELAYPYGYVYITLECFADTQEAIDMHALHLKSPWRERKPTTKTVNADYEYYFTTTHTYTRSDHLFGLFPEGEYTSEVGVRHRNVVFKITETSRQRERRLDDVIDRLLAEYEEYKKDL